jgi:hypothetical protein
MLVKNPAMSSPPGSILHKAEVEIPADSLRKKSALRQIQNRRDRVTDLPS